MKKSVLKRIREKAGVVRGEVETTNTYTTLKMSKDMLKMMKASNAQENVWLKKRDQAQQVCGLEPDADGLYDYDKIDMTNPIVELEHFLCDPRNRAQTSQHLPKERRDRYLRQHLSEDAVALFWDPELGQKWDKSGTPWNTEGMTPYYELEFRFSDVSRSMGLGNIQRRQAEQGADIDGDVNGDVNGDVIGDDADTNVKKEQIKEE